ncbi:hypothetical protein [Acetobacterium paludosum]|nr:hypothetical protein [Acetobacterium paludosum]
MNCFKCSERIGNHCKKHDERLEILEVQGKTVLFEPVEECEAEE